MPRKARLDAAGMLHHVMIRGIERRNIFRDNRDRDTFLSRLGTLLAETKTCCYAWSLMPNHAHFLFRTGGTPLSTLMARLLTGYAGDFNKRHTRHGRLFQNRYKSILCEEEPYFAELVRYIHLNPLRGKMSVVASLDALEAYRYSGHSVIMGNALETGRTQPLRSLFLVAWLLGPGRLTLNLLLRGCKRETGQIFQEGA